MKVFLVILVAFAAAAYADEVPSGKYATAETAGQDARDKLLDKIFEGYKPYSYPENTTIKFGVSLLNVEFDEEHDVMNAGVWLRESWMDRRLSWDKEAEGISVLRVPPGMMWKPDVTLYNGANSKMECEDTNMLIYPNGQVLWVPPCRIKSFCNITLSKDPYGEQVCSWKFGSWTFDGETMGLDFWQDEKKTETDYFVSTRRFKVTQNSAIKEEKKYDCCVEPYFDLLFTMGFQRHPEGFHTCTT